MDRACVHRARYLRERIGFVDDAETTADFTDFVAGTAKSGDFATFKARWERARTGIVLTAHPTFGLSAAAVRAHGRISPLPAAPENQIDRHAAPPRHPRHARL